MDSVHTTASTGGMLQQKHKKFVHAALSMATISETHPCRSREAYIITDCEYQDLQDHVFVMI